MTLLRKSLESDEIIYIEGRPTRSFVDSETVMNMSPDKLQKKVMMFGLGNSGFNDLVENKQKIVDRELAIERANAEDTYSAFDHEEEYIVKQQKIDTKKMEVASGFETWNYFTRIFPTKKI